MKKTGVKSEIKHVFMSLYDGGSALHTVTSFFLLLVNEFIMQLHKVTVKCGQFRYSLSERLTFTPVAPYCLAAVNHSIYFHGLSDSSHPPPAPNPSLPTNSPGGGGNCQKRLSFLEITLLNGASN